MGGITHIFYQISEFFQVKGALQRYVTFQFEIWPAQVPEQILTKGFIFFNYRNFNVEITEAHRAPISELAGCDVILQ